jgi:hypothetical protein
VDQFMRNLPLLTSAQSALTRWDQPESAEFRAVVYQCMGIYSYENYETAILSTSGQHWPLWRFGLDTWHGKRMAKTILALSQVQTMLTSGVLLTPQDGDDEGEKLLHIVTLEQDRQDQFVAALARNYRNDQNLPTLLSALLQVCEAAMLPCNIKYMLLLLKEMRKYTKLSPYMIEDRARVQEGTVNRYTEEFELQRWDDLEAYDVADRAIYSAVEWSLRQAGEFLLTCHERVSELADNEDALCPAAIVRDSLAAVLHPKFT